MAHNYLFTSESVSGGHPDKIADQISDAVLDAIFTTDPNAKVACETFVTTNRAVVGGEIKTNATVEIEPLVREVISDIGYTDPEIGFDASRCDISDYLHQQSSDISQGVEREDGEIGAGDQGLMFGYACNETPELMPLPLALAHKLVERQDQLRRSGEFPWLRPDAKSQVTVRYSDGVPQAIEKVVFSTQHSPDITTDELRQRVKEHIIQPIIPEELRSDALEYFINPTGRFVIGGPNGDSGLTGRKIIVDTYGGACPHGGGAFSGKDPTKVDRSAAYAARYIAKNIVAAGLADRCTVQLAYAIGVAEPLSIMVNCHNTGRVDERELEQAIPTIFSVTPKGIITMLDLRRPIYRKTASYGHFGRELPDFTWEKTDKAPALKQHLDTIHSAKPKRATAQSSPKT